MADKIGGWIKNFFLATGLVSMLGIVILVILNLLRMNYAALGWCAGGFAGSFLYMILGYGYGELIEQQQENHRYLSLILEQVRKQGRHTELLMEQFKVKDTENVYPSLQKYVYPPCLPNEWRCTNCGRVNPDSEPICVICGSKR